MTVIFPIVAPADGEVITPEWVADVTEAVNNSAVAVPVVAPDGSVTDGTTTSTSFTNTLTTTGIQGSTFVAPASGVVLIAASTSARNSNAGGFCLVDFEVREGAVLGSGTLTRASSENTAASHQSDSANQQSTCVVIPTPVTGLVAGTTYNASITYRVTANTGTFNRRKISIVLT